MGEYELVIFLTGNRISVMEVDLKSKSKIIGFHGEDYYQYDKIDDIDDFYKNITDTYNVDDLSELSTNVFLIDCGMEQETKWHLIDKLKSCECLNINNLSCLLPILLSKKGLLQVGKQTVVEFLDEKYAYICDDEYHVEELSTRGKKAQQVLNLEDFSFIAVWEGNLASGNNNDFEKKMIEAESKWEVQKKDFQSEIATLNETIKTLECKYKEVQDDLQKRLNEEKDNISQERVSNRRLITVDIEYNTRFIKEEVKNGENVSPNQRIGSFIYRREYQDETEQIYAPRAGKLVWLFLDGDEMCYVKMYEKKKVTLGVVGDEDDNEEDMIKWAKKIEENKKKK